MTLFKSKEGRLSINIKDRQKGEEVINFGQWQITKCFAQRIREGMLTFVVDQSKSEQTVQNEVNSRK